MNKYNNVGIGILPSTDINVLSDYIDNAHSVLLLTVNPDSLIKVKQLIY